jgi:hypothetical protein
MVNPSIIICILAKKLTRRKIIFIYIYVTDRIDR